MKKKIILSAVIFVILIIIVLFNFGLQIGNVKIGKQNNLIGVKQNIELSDSDIYKNYINSNDLTVLNLWATWCAPCIEEMPLLNQIKSDLNNQKINFISYSMDEDTIKLRNFLNKDLFKFTDVTLKNLEYRTSLMNFVQQKDKNNKINSYVLPVTYFIKNGKILKEYKGGFDSKDELKAIINDYNN